MPRRLVVCADGTWNTQEGRGVAEPPPTNVVKLARAVRPVAADGSTQIVYYHEGVGNGSPLLRFLGGVAGYGLSRNIRDCYRFLVDNYMPGDQLYFFGFSRGAYTVRSLVGMIRNSGLLKGEHAHLIGKAYDLYRGRSTSSHPNSVDSKAFREAYSHDVEIECLGVWDSVGALGLPTFGPLGRRLARKYAFHDVRLSGHVRHAYHALAIDEQRKPFLPAIWEVDTPGQDVEQVWFAGVHSNVGGGYPDCGLSDVALQWMLDKAAALGLEFDERYVQLAVTCAADGEIYDSMSLGYKLMHPLMRPAFKGGRRVINEPRPPRNGKSVRTCERVHESVHERIRRVTSPPRGPYAPPNLPPNLLTPPAMRSADLLAGLRGATSAATRPGATPPAPAATAAAPVPAAPTPAAPTTSAIAAPPPVAAAPPPARPVEPPPRPERASPYPTMPRPDLPVELPAPGAPSAPAG